jgi:uncharacterized membrane protein YfcA
LDLSQAELLAAAVFVGFLIGAVGIGGVLLIPALIALAALTPHQASATALFTFLFTGILGTVLFSRKGSIDWRQTGIVCGAAIVFSYLGAVAASRVGDATLTWVLAALIILAGVYVFLPAKPRQAGAAEAFRPWLLVFIGAASGFGSGFSGAGGPLFSVPLMMIFGFSPLSAIGTSQVLQIFSAAAGTLANLQYNGIHWQLAAWITCAELVGVIAGVRLAHSLSPGALRRGAGVLLLVVGGWMLFRGL